MTKTLSMGQQFCTDKQQNCLFLL